MCDQSHLCQDGKRSTLLLLDEARDKLEKVGSRPSCFGTVEDMWSRVTGSVRLLIYFKLTGKSRI